MDINLFRKFLTEAELPKLKATMHKDTGYTTDAGSKFKRVSSDVEVLVQKEKPTKWIVHFPDGTIGVSSSNGKFTFHS